MEVARVHRPVVLLRQLLYLTVAEQRRRLRRRLVRRVYWLQRRKHLCNDPRVLVAHCGSGR